MKKQTFLIGSYTDGEGALAHANGAGISSCTIDLETGALDDCVQLLDLKNPSYICRVAQNKNLFYATSENFKRDGVATSFLLDDSGNAKILSSESTTGKANCHILSIQDRLIVASYSDGQIISQRVVNGIIKGDAQTIKYSGSGPNEKRQEAPHAHQVVSAPDGKSFFTVDLGSDTIWHHDIGEAISDPRMALKAPAGSGPRHMVFHPRLPMCYIVCELTNDILICSWEAEKKALKLLNRILGMKASPEESAAAIRFHPTENLVAASFRGTDRIAFYKLDESGQVANQTNINAEGKIPRDFNFTPDGKWMVAAHQNSDTIASFSVEIKSGSVTANPVSKVNCGTPVCICF